MGNRCCGSKNTRYVRQQGTSSYYENSHSTPLSSSSTRFDDSENQQENRTVNRGFRSKQPCKTNQRSFYWQRKKQETFGKLRIGRRKMSNFFTQNSVFHKFRKNTSSFGEKEDSTWISSKSKENRLSGFRKYQHMDQNNNKNNNVLITSRTRKQEKNYNNQYNNNNNNSASIRAPRPASGERKRC